MSEIAEKIEEAAEAEKQEQERAHEHGHEPGKGPSHKGGHIHRNVGITMAAIGVMLAICSAMVGAERTELVQSMVLQSNTYNEYQAASGKYRTLHSETQQVYAMTPSRKLLDATLTELAAEPVPKDQTEMAARERDQIKRVITLLTPRTAEVADLIDTVTRYDVERKAVQKWAESYDQVVDEHLQASERFEKAQVVAEIGIVLASIALLLSSRAFWIAGIVSGVSCAGMLGGTYFTASHNLAKAEQRVEEAQDKYLAIHDKKTANGKREAEVHDADVLSRIRERFGIPEPAVVPDTDE